MNAYDKIELLQGQFIEFLKEDKKSQAKIKELEEKLNELQKNYENHYHGGNE